MTLLIFSLILFFCSILIFFDLPHTFFWKLSVVTTEYGRWCAVIPAIVVLSCSVDSAAEITAAILSFLSALLFLYPSFAATVLSRKLPARMEQSFGIVPVENENAFRWMKQWFGRRPAKVNKEKFVIPHRDGRSFDGYFFRAPENSPAPCVIVLHTGGWDSGSPEEFEPLNHFLAGRGFSVAAVSYRFAPEYRWPAQKDDLVDALEFLQKHHERFQIDPERIVLMGRSAGGQIAEAAAYSLHRPSIRGCIALYSPADLNFAYEHLSPEPDMLDSRRLLEQYLGGSQVAVRPVYDDASSYNHVTSDSPPTLLLHGAKDPLTWYKQSERLSEKLSAHGVPNMYIELPWGTHAFDFSFNGPGGQISRYAIEKFLRHVTKP